MKEFLLELLQVLAMAAVPVCTAFLIQFLRRKSEQVKAQTSNAAAKELLTEITDAVTTAVAYVSQTYVDTLKKNGEFTKEAQANAAQRAFTICRASLSSEAIAFIEAHCGDLTRYLTMKIEAEVRAQKAEMPVKNEKKGYAGYGIVMGSAEMAKSVTGCSPEETGVAGPFGPALGSSH